MYKRIISVLVVLCVLMTQASAMKRPREDESFSTDNKQIIPITRPLTSPAKTIAPPSGPINHKDKEPTKYLWDQDLLRDLWLIILSYKGVPKALGTVCKTLETLRCDKDVPLEREFDSPEALQLYLDNPVHPKPRVKSGTLMNGFSKVFLTF